MLTKFPSDKLNVSKNALFLFLLFFFLASSKSPVLLLTEAQVHLSKTVCGIFPLQFRLVFIKLYIFIQKRADSLTLKRHHSFQNKNNRKITHSFAPKPLIFKLQQV